MRLLALLVSVAVAGCNYNVAKMTVGDGPKVNAEQAANPDFKTVQTAVLNERCATCHSNRGGNQGATNLEDYNSVRAKLNRVIYRSLEKRDMPSGVPLSEPEARILQNWIDLGAPEFVSPVLEKPDLTLDKGPNDWSKVNLRIFSKKCNDCHSGPNPDAGLDLSDIKIVRAKITVIFERLIVKGDMPVAPYPTLTPKERKVVLGWIDSGMPE